MYSRDLRVLIFTFVLAASAVSAQGQLPDAGTIAIAGGGPKAGVVTMRVEAMDVEPAKGLPFCATVVTEHTQAFADGNRIHTSDSSSVCRDSEGRTRREAALNLLGAAAETSTPKLVTIIDPIAGYRFMLDSESKTAHKMPIGLPKALNTAGALPLSPEKGEPVVMFQSVTASGPNIGAGKDFFFRSSGRASDDAAPATESLGDQTIDGIHATGTRMTTTIPAGKMGNEQPILVTSERWYSPELKATIMSKHSDPWAGELKTQLTNVSSSEPDSSLFQVPSDYKIVDDNAGPFILQKQILAPSSR